MQFSWYNFVVADVNAAWEHFKLYESECQQILDGFRHTEQSKNTGSIKSYPLLAAFDLCLKCSHLFNILDARGAISVTERVGVIARVRALAVGVAKAWMEQQYGRSDAVAMKA